MDLFINVETVENDNQNSLNTSTFLATQWISLLFFNSFTDRKKLTFNKSVTVSR